MPELLPHLDCQCHDYLLHWLEQVLWRNTNYFEWSVHIKWTMEEEKTVTFLRGIDREMEKREIYEATIKMRCLQVELGEPSSVACLELTGQVLSSILYGMAKAKAEERKPCFVLEHEGRCHLFPRAWVEFEKMPSSRLKREREFS